MNTLFDIDSLRQAQYLIYERTLVHYANSVLNGDISFDRAVKTLQYDTRANPYDLEQDLSEVILEICPVRDSQVP